ncbi:Glycosyltransferase Family 34 protein [Gigaspora rosea]|uniref:Glycosyltransferase Family 34 protein n=1 Tax=Gigaspora rosea TaxID=44941 RepID=A0A397W3W9_9GLOM|nr:Glycosyltransferase Family 34 protein [Gigaspora rosea]
MFDILRTNNNSISSLEPRRYRRQKLNTYLAIFSIVFAIIIIFILFFSIQNYYSNSIGLSSNAKTNNSYSNLNDSNNNVTGSGFKNGNNNKNDGSNGYIEEDLDNMEDENDEFENVGNVVVKPPIPHDKNVKIEINTSNHYKLFILITSELIDYRKRNLLREFLFGIENNLEPCISYNMDLYYKFLIPPHDIGQNKELYKNFISEIIENNDIVEFQNLLGSNFTQETILNWVQTQKDYNITFDHLVLIGGNSVANLEEIDFNLSQNTEDDEYSANLPKVIWGNFETPSADNIVVIGTEAIKTILENKDLLKHLNYSNLITQAYFYTKENAESLSNNLQSLLFLNDDKGFIVWNGTIETIPKTPTIGVGNLLMADDLIKVTEHLSIPFVPPCHLTTPSEGEPRIAVVTSSSFEDDSNNCKPSILDISFASANNKRKYSQKYGYSFIPLQTSKRKIVTWGRIDAIKRTLSYYDWVLWIDTNSVITNYNVSISDLIEKFYLIIGKRAIYDVDVDEKEKYEKGKEIFDKKINIVIAEPKEGDEADAGMLLIKNSGWSFGFIRNVQAVRDKSTVERGSIWRVLEDFPEFQKRVLLISHKEYPLNSSPKDWKKGDFIINYDSTKCPAKSIANSLKLNVEKNSS